MGVQYVSRIILRSDTSENLEKYNPVLGIGEPCFDTTNKILKIGDGVTPWCELKSIMQEELLNV